MLLSPQNMIRWRLREFMARYKITNRQLASALGRHETSVSRLKSQDTMPRLDGELLDSLCKGLAQCLRENHSDLKLATPNDLIEFTFDEPEPPTDSDLTAPDEVAAKRESKRRSPRAADSESSYSVDVA